MRPPTDPAGAGFDDTASMQAEGGAGESPEEVVLMASSLRWINVGLRGLMELGIVAGLGYWGLVDFRRAGRAAEPLRLARELVVGGLAAAAWYAAGAALWGWALALLAILHHALVYLPGDRLLRP